MFYKCIKKLAFSSEKHFLGCDTRKVTTFRGWYVRTRKVIAKIGGLKSKICYGVRRGPGGCQFMKKPEFENLILQILS